MLVDWFSFTNSIVPISTSNFISITSISLSSLIISRVTEAETSLLPVLSGFQYSPWTGRLRNGQGLCENWVNVRGRSSWWGRVPEWDERQVLAVFFFCIYFIVLDRLLHISKLYRGRPIVSNWHSPPASSHLRTPPSTDKAAECKEGWCLPHNFFRAPPLASNTCYTWVELVGLELYTTWPTACCRVVVGFVDLSESDLGWLFRLGVKCFVV